MDCVYLGNRRRSVIRFLQIEDKKLWIETKFCDRQRYVYAIIVRGEEEKGVREFVATKFLHQQIVEQLIDNPLMPKLSFWQRISEWLADRKLSKWFGVNKWFTKFVPKPKLATDLKEGFDFEILVEMKGARKEEPAVALNGTCFIPKQNSHPGFPSYTGKFIKVSCPAGTDDQISKWMDQVCGLRKSLPV